MMTAYHSQFIVPSTRPIPAELVGPRPCHAVCRGVVMRPQLRGELRAVLAQGGDEGGQPGQQDRVGQLGERGRHQLHHERRQPGYRVEGLHEAGEVLREGRHHQGVGQQVGAAGAQLGQRQQAQLVPGRPVQRDLAGASG